MFYVASRIAAVVLPLNNLLLFFTVVGAVALLMRRMRLGRNVLGVVLAVYVVCGCGPVGFILLRPLEDRFPRPADEAVAPAGIIVLGGALRAQMTNARGAIALSEGGGRMTQAVILALRHPDARVVFTGTTGGLLQGEADEAENAQRFFATLGVSPSRILLERRSRNTDENAAFTRELVQPQPGEQWILVTSAAHVPRAMGSFRRAGFEVTPYPTDYRTEGKPSEFWTFRVQPWEGIGMFDVAIHEWLGLIAYRLSGRSQSLFPGPVTQD